jgi:hypothetical protein
MYNDFRFGQPEPAEDTVVFDPFGVFTFFAVLILVGGVGAGVYMSAGSGGLGMDLENLLWQDQTAVKLSRGLTDHFGPVIVTEPSARATVATPAPDELWPELNPRIANLRAGAKLRVLDSGGAGVVLRSTPRDAEAVARWPEGTVLVYDGEHGEAEGLRWVKVKAPSGTVGWVPAQHLAPAY